MKLNTLENLSVPELTSLFNEAFADYFVKIELTPEVLQEKIISENILLDKSVGIFNDDKAIGFILHALRNGVAYNAGTGVIPQFRGQNATVKMYEYVLPKLKEAGVTEIVLEVMDENTQAIKSYKKAGFSKTRNLFGFQGKVLNDEPNTLVKIETIENTKIPDFQSYWDWKPTWQHTTETVINSTTYKTYGAFLQDKLVGYLAANPLSGRVAQFAVKPEYRKQGIATALFRHLSKIYADNISVINIDGEQTETHNFLTKLGLKHTITQYKMKLNLKHNKDESIWD